MPLDDRYFDSAGVPIRYVAAGQGEPLLLLHGFSSSIEEGWADRGVIADLADRWRVIAFDARGHGRSGKPHDPASYGPEMGRDVLRLMDHLGIGRAHVMGYSMGAHVAAHLAVHRPSRLHSLILGGAVGRVGWQPADQARVDAEAAELDQGLLSGQILRLWPKDQAPPSQDELRALSARRLAGKDPHALAAVRRSNPAQVVTLEELAALPMPVLGIVGTADPYRRDFERLQAAMPALRLVEIEGAVHGNAVGRPEYVAAVRGFLADHPMAGTEEAREYASPACSLHELDPAFRSG